MNFNIQHKTKKNIKSLIKKKSFKKKVLSGGGVAFFINLLLKLPLSTHRKTSVTILNLINDNKISEISIDDWIILFKIKKIIIKNGLQPTIMHSLFDAEYSNSECLNYYKKNNTIPLPTLQKILLSTYLTPHMKDLNNLFNIDIIINILPIFDKILEFDIAPLVFTKLSEKLKITKTISFEDIDLLLVLVIAIINNTNEDPVTNGNITLIKFINYMLDILIEVYSKKNSQISYNKDMPPAFIWLIDNIFLTSGYIYNTHVKPLLNTTKIYEEIEKHKKDLYIIYEKFIKNCIDTMKIIRRTTPVEPMPPMDIQAFLIYHIETYKNHPDYKFINFGFLIDLITQGDNLGRSQIHNFLWNLLHQKQINTHSHTSTSSEPIVNTFDKTMFENNVDWNIFERKFKFNEPTLFHVINNQDHKYLILPYILSSIGITSTESMSENIINKIIVILNKIYIETNLKQCKSVTITEHQSGEVFDKYTQSLLSSLLQKIIKTILGNNGIGEICESLHRNHTITTDSLTELNNFISNLLKSDILHITNIFKNIQNIFKSKKTKQNVNNLIVRNILKKIFLYNIIKYNIDKYIITTINKCLESFKQNPIEYTDLITLLATENIPQFRKNDIYHHITIQKLPNYQTQEYENRHISRLLDTFIINNLEISNSQSQRDKITENFKNYFLTYYEILNTWLLIWQIYKGDISKISEFCSIRTGIIKTASNFLLKDHKITNTTFISIFFEYQFFISSPFIERLLLFEIQDINTSKYIKLDNDYLIESLTTDIESGEYEMINRLSNNEVYHSANEDRAEVGDFESVSHSEAVPEPVNNPRDRLPTTASSRTLTKIAGVVSSPFHLMSRGFKKLTKRNPPSTNASSSNA